MEKNRFWPANLNCTEQNSEISLLPTAHFFTDRRDGACVGRSLATDDDGQERTVTDRKGVCFRPYGTAPKQNYPAFL